jgi:hypothetical protein
MQKAGFGRFFGGATRSSIEGEASHSDMLSDAT